MPPWAFHHTRAPFTRMCELVASKKSGQLTQWQKTYACASGKRARLAAESA